MSNIKSVESHERAKSQKKGKNTFPYALLLACALAISNPAESKVIDNWHFNTEVVADSSIIKNIEKKI